MPERGQRPITPVPVASAPRRPDTNPTKAAPVQRKKRRTPDTDPTVSMDGADYLGPDGSFSSAVPEPGSQGPRPASVDLPPSRTATVIYDEPGLPDLLAIRIDAPDEPPDDPSDRSSSVAFPLGIAMILTGLGLLFLGGAGALIVGIYWATSQSVVEAERTPELPIPISAPVPAPELPTPVAPVKPTPPEPANAAKPAPAAPPPKPNTPVPEPARPAAPVPVPVIVIPDPVPAEVAPVPEPVPEVVPDPVPEVAPVSAEPTPDTPARLVVSGDVLVELEGDYGGFRQGTPLPPGGYSVRADFGAGLVDTGLRTIATPGGTVTVKCADGACTVSP